MKLEVALKVWDALASEQVVGCDNNGDEVTTRTMGSVAVGVLGIPTNAWILRNRPTIAAFLREMADALDPVAAPAATEAGPVGGEG